MNKEIFLVELCLSVQFSRSVVSDSLRPHEPHVRHSLTVSLYSVLCTLFINLHLSINIKFDLGM